MRKITTLYLTIKKSPFLFFILLFCFVSSVLIVQTAYWTKDNHYIFLANAFLQGRLDIIPLSLPMGDIALFKDKYFVYFGPLPAIMLLPFVIFFKNLSSQHILAIGLSIVDFFLLYQIAKRIVKKAEDAAWLSVFFIFGTIFIFFTLLNLTAYQVQIIAISFLIFALYEFFYKRRWLLMGVFIALAGMTRPTLFLTAIFFIFGLLSSISEQNRKRKLIIFIIPLVISFILLGTYNFLRFSNIFETGYNHALLGSHLKPAMTKGLFSLSHIPGNLFLLFLKGPDPIKENLIDYQLKFPFFRANEWGMGIFFTSPLFLYIFLSDLRKKIILHCWIIVLIMLIPTLTYFGIGVSQYGFRNALDFYPFLFLILLNVFKDHLTLRAKTLIVYSIFFNFFFMLSIWGVYPY